MGSLAQHRLFEIAEVGEGGMIVKPRIFKRGGWWNVDVPGYGRLGGMTLSQAFTLARMSVRSQMIRDAGIAANREADERVMNRPYVNPRSA